MANDADQVLWEAVVTADRELQRRQNAFNDNATDPSRVLADALGGKPDGWARWSALHHVQRWQAYVIRLLPELLPLALEERTHRSALNAIMVARGRCIPALEPLVRTQLEDGMRDWKDYALLGSLLSELQAWDLLRDVTEHALANTDSETRQLGTELAEDYSWLWTSKPT